MKQNEVIKNLKEAIMKHLGIDDGGQPLYMDDIDAEVLANMILFHLECTNVINIKWGEELDDEDDS